MKIVRKAGLKIGMVSCLLLGAAGAIAVDEDDPAEKQQEAAKQRYEVAKDNCKRLQGQDRERCDDKAQGDYVRELDTIRQNASPGVMGEGPDREGRQGNPQKSRY